MGDPSDSSAPLGQWMEQDHERMDALWDQAKQSWPTDREQATSLFRAFRVGLLRHIQAEEELLFPFFENREEASAKQMIDVLREDHVQIRDDLDALLRKVETGSPDLEPEDTRLRNALWAHNAREEGVLYPWFDERSSAGEGSDLSKKVRALISGDGALPEAPKG
ncbi:MAG: hemerythrin domain-containing protein [Thermoplasmata archaeon]